ncbi:hypothetical protein GCM10025857_55610 [Alicyclobacillus contaminans]|uniref:Fatty acid biosynthesis transcriptional regulator n=1 Tax=Tetragenococcus muriaticus 3MR10-3 TaxID=1302648 RepID=A0A091BZQ8_9ENTE|nr:fatty acid biosynthesis transcriptional regulator [Tetragenococcus muriaticus 3MR10-3]GMA54204.1 hypothetical protein GCM10025857_55610 [Alicyclobacillus contaminans]
MEPNFERINTLLVEAFNDILVIEESELKKSQFNDLSITEMHTIEAIGMYKKRLLLKWLKNFRSLLGH